MVDLDTQYALTTIFTPRPSCSPGSFDQLLYQQSNIFINYPDPVPGNIQSSCYPSQFLDSYLSQKTVTTLLPPIAPLICPSGWDRATIDYAPTVPSSYIACCPHGYSLMGPHPPWPATRPAFNATCASLVRTLLVTPFVADGALPATTWTGTPGDHIYALPFEGYVSPPLTSAPTLQQVSSTFRTTSPTDPTNANVQTSWGTISATAARSPSPTSSVANNSHSLSKGAIAGISIGSAFTLLLVGAILFLGIRRVVMRHQATRQSEATHLKHVWI